MNNAEKRILLLLGPGFEDVEAVTTIGAWGWTTYRDTLPVVTVEIAALHPQIEGQYGIKLDADVLVQNADPCRYDALVIPGGFRDLGFEEIYCEPVYKLIRAMDAKGAPIATMCTGILSVARAGIMNGRHATSYEFSRRSNYAILEECGAVCEHLPVVFDGNIASCSGPAYTEQVISWLMEQVLGPQDAARLSTYRRGISPEYLAAN